MSVKLVFATHNRGKVAELHHLLAEAFGPDALQILTAHDLALPEVIEDGDTFAANAYKKAREIANATGLWALADDSGLEVDALGGQPGVFSARYAGEPSHDGRNNQKLLQALTNVPEKARTARFRCVLALAEPNTERHFLADGTCEGRILHQAKGSEGFGYDPLFFSDELGKTFAEADHAQKSLISHRGRAMKAMLPTLRTELSYVKSHNHM